MRRFIAALVVAKRRTPKITAKGFVVPRLRLQDVPRAESRDHEKSQSPTEKLCVGTMATDTAVFANLTGRCLK
ncbi:MAG: hypothetical protein CMJ78_06920 [Planctomycetaceae bacterium]|nr:hypothetical protein [Planctomycetaceae bacterium]